MFKKKSASCIPDRPLPPDSKHILEDLLNASNSDPLFTLSLDMGDNDMSSSKLRATSLTNKEYTKGVDEDLPLISNELKARSEDVYIQVKNFVATNSNLYDLMHVLQEKNDSLQLSDLELKGLAKHIREQALAALK